MVRDLLKAGDALTLEFAAGVVPVTAQGDAWTFTAPCPDGVRTAPPALARAEIASLAGLDAADLSGDPIWVDTGADQLLMPVASVEALRRVAPDASRLDRWQANSIGRRSCTPLPSTRAGRRTAARWWWRGTSTPRRAAA